MELKVKRLSHTAKLPTKGHSDDHCFDFYADRDVVLRPGDTCVIHLGVAVVPPEGYALIFKERSGLAVRGLAIGAGVIDNGYRGELCAVVRYIDHDPENLFSIHKGDKIIQGKLEKTIDAAVVEITDLDETNRGDAGFGSTGK